ncbi:phosphoribosylcarboxyaminoimidazole (NCAIR) mutase [Geodermatophilus bullaregiensis]|uniref:FUSC family protein n=1 Tax=Geodermatophilus bullaregiensis TaxID=1564160 RepID=UPI0019561564|nr:FUSC family protein [Geodermatophilus bullaregiensis]MBM7804423.1 phosphoribosylcarboxyaminoimidazole (NCAIR) mutase [Geodermatophilus bullaregiensis]
MTARRRRIGVHAAAWVLLVRQRGRSAAFRAARMTGATVAAFLVAQGVGLHTPPPLIAALTALLVVQATLSSTLLNGVQRVLSVVAGVALAVLFTAVVGLTWWSLAALVAASILAGQLLRLGPHLVEVPISAMLVLGASGAEDVGGGRVVETLIGAAVGVLVNVAFPPAVQTRFATQALERFADEIACLLHDAASALRAGPVTVEQSTRWLEDARRLNRHAPRVDRALAHAEESRRLNLRALRVPPVGRTARTGLDALEHASVSLRTLFRAVDDATRERTGVQEDAGYADVVRRTVASLLERMGTVVLEFGRVLVADARAAAGTGQGRMAGALQALRSGRALVQDLLIGDPRSHSGLWEVNSTLLATIDRVLDEFDTVGDPPAQRPAGDPSRTRWAATTAGQRLRAARRSPTRHGSGAVPGRPAGEDA